MIIQFIQGTLRKDLSLDLLRNLLLMLQHILKFALLVRCYELSSLLKDVLAISISKAAG